MREKESGGFGAKHFEVVLNGDYEVLKSMKVLVQAGLKVRPAGCSARLIVGKVPGLLKQQQRLLQCLAGDCCIRSMFFGNSLILKCRASENPTKFFGALLRSSSFLRGIEVREVEGIAI